MAGGGADAGLDRAGRAGAPAAGAGAGRPAASRWSRRRRACSGEAAEQAPLCVLLDDAHLADATTLDALELATLGRGGRTVPLWICVLARPSFDALRPSWGERAERAEAVELRAAVRRGGRGAVPDAAPPGGEPAGELVAKLIERAHGNAMLLGELCRALKSEKIIRQERTGAWILETDRVDAWPHTPRLQWLAERELSRLPPDLASHAQLAALLGPKFAVADMIGVMKVLETSAVARQFPLDPKVALAQLDRAQILRVRERHGCEFRNAMLCEAMRSAIPEALRIELHRAAFEHYRDLRHAPEERRRPRLAFHAAEAGLREPAAMAYEALAVEHLYRHRYVEAEGGVLAHALARGQRAAAPGGAPRPRARALPHRAVRGRARRICTRRTRSPTSSATGAPG